MAVIALIGSSPFLIEGLNALSDLTSDAPDEPAAAAKALLILVSVVPLTVAVWAWRAGTDANEYGLRIKALFGRQIIPWSHVEALAPDGRGHAVAVLKTGQVFRLTAVKPADLPRLAAARSTPAPADVDAPA